MNATRPTSEDVLHAAIWMAITAVRKHELARLYAENASLRAQLVMLNYENHRPQFAAPADKPEEEIYSGPAWRRRPRRRALQLTTA